MYGFYLDSDLNKQILSSKLLKNILRQLGKFEHWRFDDMKDLLFKFKCDNGVEFKYSF